MKAINVAWNEYRADINRDRKAYADVDKIFAIPNVVESFQFEVEEEPFQWRVHILPTPAMRIAFQQAITRGHLGNSPSMLSRYDSIFVIRKADFKILKRITLGERGLA